MACENASLHVVCICTCMFEVRVVYTHAHKLSLSFSYAQVVVVVASFTASLQVCRRTPSPVHGGASIKKGTSQRKQWCCRVCVRAQPSLVCQSANRAGAAEHITYTERGLFSSKDNGEPSQGQIQKRQNFEKGRCCRARLPS